MTTPPGPIRVLVVDDQELVRSGFCVILDTVEDITVVGEAANGEAALAAAVGCRPDVVLMDIRMPGLNGLEATRALHAEQVQLEDAYARAKSGATQVVLVEGEPGIGKSRLMHEFLRGAGTLVRADEDCDNVVKALEDAQLVATKTIDQTMDDIKKATQLWDDTDGAITRAKVEELPQ